jgi:(p)ppGpp synthase/HD superfamily hydrolase
VVSRDRTGLLKDLTSVISSMNLMILGSQSKSYTQKGQAILKFQILVENAKQINDLLNRLKNVNGVISLTRTLRHNY